MRAKTASKRKIEPDSVYKSQLVTRFINYLMWDGKKKLARKVVYSLLERISEDNKEALEKFESAVENVMPDQEVRGRRVGGATYQVPIPLKHRRSQSLAIKWIIDSARNKKGSSIEDRIYNEIQAALNNDGAAVKKKEEMERMAASNQAFSHFRW